MLEKYKQLASEVLKIAKGAGAELVSISIGNSRSFEVEVRESKIDVLKEAGASGISVSVCKDKRRSSLFSNDLHIEKIESLIKSTMGSLQFMGADEFFTLPEQSRQGKAACDLNLVDKEFESYSSAGKVREALELEKSTLSIDKRLTTEQAYHSDSISYCVYADSNGFLDGDIDTYYGFGMSVFVEDKAVDSTNKERKQTDGWYTNSRFYNRLDDINTIAKKASHRVLRKLGATKPESQEVPIVFCPEMARSFLGNLAAAMMGRNIFRKNSFLKDRLGEKIANDVIDLRDDPLLPGKLGSRYFDGEGVISKPLSLIENGVLKNYMLSTYSANKLNMETTGHAGGISNLILEPGKYSEDELIGSVKNGLFLTFLSGQGANITTGDYSRGAQGIWIRDGKLAEPVAEFTIAGKFLEMLNNISMIGNEVDERGSILAPAFKVDKMAISGT